MPTKGQTKGNKIEVLGGVGLIHLQRGIALVDVNDIERAAAFTWHSVRDSSRTRAVAHYYCGKKRRTMFLSRLILFGDRQAIEPLIAEHRNHNSLDCRKNNLRPATAAQNAFNNMPRRNTLTGLKGVSWQSGRGKWRAKIGINGRRISLGLFTTKEGAARAYDVAASKLYGEFAKTNF